MVKIDGEDSLNGVGPVFSAHRLCHEPRVFVREEVGGQGWLQVCQVQRLAVSLVDVADHVRVGDQVSLMVHQEAGHVVMMAEVTVKAVVDNFVKVSLSKVQGHDTSCGHVDGEAGGHGHNVPGAATVQIWRRYRHLAC